MTKPKSGLLIDVRVGESVTISRDDGVDTEKITFTLLAKGGQKARLRIVAGQSIRVGRPQKTQA